MASEEDILESALAALLSSGDAAGGDLARELRGYPLHVVAPLGRCRKIVYTTKIDWLAGMTKGLEAIPDDVCVMWRFGPLTVQHRSLLGSMVRALDAPVHFVGDLDPLDLVTFATLAELSPKYDGVDDSWLALCERYLRPDKALSSVCIRMDEVEKDALGRLMGAQWPNPIGQRALTLLASGLKLELEGATTPEFYVAGFHDQVIARLLR